MDKLEAQSKGLPWISFGDIPQFFKNMYDLMLACNQIAGTVVRQTDSYEMCCEYWFNNTLHKAIDNATDLTTDAWRELLKGIDEVVK